MKISKYLSIVALVLVGAVMTGCSSDNDFVAEATQQPVANKGNVVTLTTTVSLDNGNTTRALTDRGVKTFAVGDKIAVVYQNEDGNTVKVESSELTTTDITNDGKSGKFTVTLTNAKADGSVRYIYPAAMAATTIAEATAVSDDATVNYAALATQDGTLDNLAKNRDLAIFDGSLTASATLPASPLLVNKLAILAYTLKNVDGSSDITNTITDMTVTDGTYTYAVNRSAAEGPIYVAIRPTSSASIAITATGGAANYEKSLTGKTYEAGNGYSISLKMLPAATDLSMVDCAGNARTSRRTANCYMVHTAGNYKLPLVYGNAIKDGADNTTAYKPGGTTSDTYCANFVNHNGDGITAPWIKDNGITVLSAELLWQDAEGLVTAVDIEGDYLTLTVGEDAATQEGNALVAAKDGDGNVVWSWHIWVTKQTFAEDDLTIVATGSHDYKVTPVNLGWVGDRVSQGTNTFYQWGRKDPFRGSESVGDPVTTGIIADNIKNPTTFYNVDDKPCSESYYNMWDAQQTGTDNITTATKKTVYDPCPAGFCVPTGNLYYYMAGGFYRDDKNWLEYTGKTFTISDESSIFFPASGYRDGSDGSLGNVGSYGYCSAASARGSSTYDARYLNFNSGYWRWGSSSRSYGFPVRAVAEE